MADVRLPASLAALIDAGVAIAGEAYSSKVAAARLEGVVRPELVPAALRDDVAASIERGVRATSGDPLPAREIEKLLKAAWGSPPGKVLDDIDLDSPIAVRPHAQTYRAELDGEPVAVKVARPRAAQTTRSDLVLLDALARPLGATFPSMSTAPLMREIRERVMDELDLEHEGEIHRRVARGLRRMEGVEVARVHSELTSEGVHVSSFLEGPTLASGARPDDPAAVARLLVRVYLGAPRGIGLVLANPRASDVVLLPAGGIGLIGPGAARAVEASRTDTAVRALEALRAGDEAAFASAAADLGVLPVAAARTAYAHVERILGPLVAPGPARLDDAALAAAGERALDSLGPLMEIAGEATPDPADLWPLRSLGQLAALLAPLGAEEDWLELGAAALRDGWS